MRNRLLVLAASIFLFAGTMFAQQAKPAQEAKKDGWWIKAIVDKPASKAMGFYVGTTDNSYRFWRVWSPGNPTEFDVPEEFKNGETLYILAQTTSGQKCAICVMYKSKGVKYLEFDLEEDYLANQSEEDKRCK